jgi:Resolvase, N terminal domain
LKKLIMVQHSIRGLRHEKTGRHLINLIAAWSVDRLGRSLQHLVGFLNELQALNCNLYLHQQAIDTTTPSGRAMFQMCGVFAEFERSMIVERVNAGLARAKANGVKLGRGNRKDNRRSADEKRWGMSRADLEKRILHLRRQDMGLVKIGRLCGAARPGFRLIDLTLSFSIVWRHLVRGLSLAGCSHETVFPSR